MIFTAAYHSSVEQRYFYDNKIKEDSLDVLKIVYFAHIHSNLSYGTIMWGSQNYSINS